MDWPTELGIVIDEPNAFSNRRWHPPRSLNPAVPPPSDLPLHILNYTTLVLTYRSQWRWKNSAAHTRNDPFSTCGILD